MTGIDRSSCTATLHGDVSAYRYGCRCGDAREDRRLYMKRRIEGRGQPRRVSPVGAARRLQALAALGWGTNQLAEHLGTTPQAVQQTRSGHRGSVTRRQHDRIAALYEQLQGTPGPSEVSRIWAQRFGWAPPLAWDDDIDNPDARPDTTPDVPRRGRIDLDEVDFLDSFGLSEHEIAERFDVDPDSIATARRRAEQDSTPELADWQDHTADATAAAR